MKPPRALLWVLPRVQYATLLRRNGSIAYVFFILLAIYTPVLGRGFIKDDFRWIATGRINDLSDLWRIFTINVGFYRPLVSATFGIDYHIFGLQPLGYGLTNLLLLLLSVLAVRGVAVRIGLSREGAILAAAIWALNFHGIGGAILWLSGRTALLLTLCASACVICWLRNAPVSASLWFAGALASKEEAVLLPALLLVAAFLWPREIAWRRPFALALCILAAYFVLRAHSGAFFVTNAPSYYKLTANPAQLLRNGLEYADRTLTFALATLVVASICVRAWPSVSVDRNMVVFVASWAIVGFGVTFFIPARSSLYVVFPSVGTSIGVASVLEKLFLASTVAQKSRLRLVALVVPLLLYPIYYARNQPMMRLAQFSQDVVASLNGANSSISAGTEVVLVDDPSSRINLANAFGSLVDQVRILAIPRACSLVVEGDSDHETAPIGDSQGCASRVVLVRVVQGEAIKSQ